MKGRELQYSEIQNGITVVFHSPDGNSLTGKVNTVELNTDEEIISCEVETADERLFELSLAEGDKVYAFLSDDNEDKPVDFLNDRDVLGLYRQNVPFSEDSQENTNYMTLTSGQLEIERRRQKNQIVINDLTTCYFCKSTGLKESDLFCPNCAFPQRGTQGEMKKFIYNVSNKKKLLADQKKAINKARNILYILAGINILYGIILGLIVSVNVPILIASVIGASIYLALGLWSRKQPFPAILSGLFVFIVFNVISAITDPATILQGILWKVIIISGFIYGYKGVKDSKTLANELESIKKAKDLNFES